MRSPRAGYGSASCEQPRSRGILRKLRMTCTLYRTRNFRNPLLSFCFAAVTGLKIEDLFNPVSTEYALARAYAFLEPRLEQHTAQLIESDIAIRCSSCRASL